LIDAISSLHLSTQDGAFIFASNESSSNSTTACSTGVDSIKTLPSTSWLPESKPVEQENEYRLPMVTHLLSLPFNAFVKSSSSSSSNSSTSTPVDTNDQPSNRLPMVSELLSMPINAFRSPSSGNKSSPIPIEEKKETYEKNFFFFVFKRLNNN
jgi:hypothetical protein